MHLRRRLSAILASSAIALTVVFGIVPAAFAQTETCPTLKIAIPGYKAVALGRIETSTTVIYQSPCLANYINAVYAYGVYAALVVAAVMAVVGGFEWLTAGDSGRIGKAKDRISNAVIGLVLALGAYTLLNTVDPNLVALNAIQVETVKPEELAIDEPGGVPEASTAGDSGAYDNDFKKYASCAGVDWRILKAVAKKESGFRAEVENKYGFIGLFQTKTQFCSLARYGRGDECSSDGLKNPDANTASAAGGQLKSGVQSLKSRCPSITDAQTFVMLLYYGHNSGPGALKYVLTKAGCDAKPADYFAASSEFWANRAKSTGKTIPNQDGRMQYSEKVGQQAVAYGVTDPFDTSQNEACPLK